MRLLTTLIIAALLVSCNKEKSTTPESRIVGTWQLISGTLIEKGDTTFTDYTKDVSMIKIINDTHFAFMNHDMKHGKDSAAASFSAGGGTYKLNGDKYTEYLEYCNAREWEDHSFDFTLTILGDTLTQTGIEKLEDIGVNRLNIERYVRIKP